MLATCMPRLVKEAANCFSLSTALDVQNKRHGTGKGPWLLVVPGATLFVSVLIIQAD